MNTCECRIRGGFPLKVTYEVDSDNYIEVDEVLTPAGKSADFLKITEAEMSEIEDECYSDLTTYGYDRGDY